MKRVAILGAGPAGAFAAEQLARSGIATSLFDEKLAWEKPCGGGITFKAYQQYPFLLDNDTPKKKVVRTCLSSESAGTAALDLGRPLLVYSRYDLNNLMLKRAEDAGAQIEKTRVLRAQRSGRKWRIETKNGMLETDYCVVATGARNPLRDMGTQWNAGDTMSSLGYFVPAAQDHIDLQFFPDFEGYIWVFPRSDHLSVGVAGKGRSAAVLRDMLHSYLRGKGISTRGATFYGHVIPSLEKPAWRGNRVAGDGWLAVGDAAGLVDPVTGEGLYYAIRSGDLAAQAILAHTEAPGDEYRSVLWREFGHDLEVGARLSKRLFRGRFLYGDVPGRMIQFVRRSPTLRGVVQDLFAGTQTYVDLKSRLKASMTGTLRDILIGWYFRGVAPNSNPIDR